MGIRTKIVLCLLGVLIPLGAVSVFAINLFDRHLIERTESALGNTQRLEAARINEILAGYQQDSRTLAAGVHVRQFVTGVHEHRNPDALKHTPDNAQPEIIGGYDGFAIINMQSVWPLQQLALSLQRKAGVMGSAVVELRIVDRKGHTLGESVGFSWQPTDPRLVSNAMNQVKTLFGDAFVTDNDENRLGLVSPIVSPESVVVGALILETRLGPITDLVAKHEGVGYSSEAHIAQPTIDGHAQIITPLRFDRKAAFNKIVPISKNLPINQSLDAIGGKILHAKDYRGIETILSIETIPATQWGLVVKMDTKEAFKPVIELRRVLAIAFGTSLLVTIASYMFCFVPIARRLKRTSNATHKIMDGNLTVRIHDSNSDEIGKMARAIDTLALELEIDQEKRADVEARLRHQASHDELTGLLNRKHANKVIKQLNDDDDHVHSVMFLDLNGFKDVNDLYGHSAGDEVLVTVAKRLSALTSDDATLARWGGDEFVVILPRTDEKDATEFALLLHNAFDEIIVTPQGIHSITCSIGLATSSVSKSLDEVLMEADILMYEQKKQHHARHTTGGMATRAVERALHEDRFEVWYQPVVYLQRPGNYMLAGAEAMVRLRTHEGGIVLHKEFRAELAGTSLNATLDRQAIISCLQTLSRWTVSGIVSENFKLSLAIDTQMLNEPEFLSILTCQLESSCINPGQLVLEPSCPSSIDPDKLASLKMLGVSFAMDKVLAEPNGLLNLSELQPDFARIDHNWLKDPIVSPHLVAICHKRSMGITARNITARDELPALHDLGVTEFQGDLFDKPLRAIDFISRWGQSPLQGLGKQVNQNIALRLTG